MELIWQTCMSYTIYENVSEKWHSRVEFKVSLIINLMDFIHCLFRIIKGASSDVSKVVHGDEFEYNDPVDGSISSHQGIRYLFEDGSRLVSLLIIIPFLMKSLLIICY